VEQPQGVETRELAALAKMVIIYVHNNQNSFFSLKGVLLVKPNSLQGNTTT
jgi:hypothetical protein